MDSLSSAILNSEIMVQLWYLKLNLTSLATAMECNGSPKQLPPVMMNGLSWRSICEHDMSGPRVLEQDVSRIGTDAFLEQKQMSMLILQWPFDLCARISVGYPLDMPDPELNPFSASPLAQTTPHWSSPGQCVSCQDLSAKEGSEWCELT